MIKSLTPTRRRLTAFLAIGALLAAAGCGEFKTVQPSKDLYFLVDVSKSYGEYSRSSLNRLRGVLYAMRANDRITVAKIQDCSYSDDAFILQTRTLSDNETIANSELLDVAQELKRLADELTPTNYTDIKGALILASQHFLRSPSQKKILVVFSDLKDEPAQGCAAESDSLIDLDGVVVVLADVSISRADQSNAGRQIDRIKKWSNLLAKRGAKRVDIAYGVNEIEAIVTNLDREVDR